MSPSMMCRHSLRPRLALTMSLIVALSTAQDARGAGPSAKAASSAPAAAVEPLPLRTGAQPIDAVRALGILQDQIPQGDEVALARLPELQGETARELASFPSDVWADARNQRALVRFVLGGGQPALLQSLAASKRVPEPDLPLVLGALAFALGDRGAAAAHLDKIDARELGRSLAGIVALVKCTLAADRDAVIALGHCDDARLLAPGSLVEEAALRISIELTMAVGDRARFASSASRYMRRFGRSLYLPVVRPVIVRFIAGHDIMARAEGVAWFDGATRNLPASVLRPFLAAISEEALRFGSLSTASAGSRRLLATMPADDPDRPRIAAFDAAARMLGPERAAARSEIERLSSAALTAPVAGLVRAAAVLGDAIAAKSAPAASHVEAVAGSAGPMAVRVRGALAEADKLIAESSK